MLGRTLGCAASRWRISVIICPCVFLRSSMGLAWQRKWICVEEEADKPETPIDGSMSADALDALQLFQQLESAISPCPRATFPPGASACIVHSPMSSFGTNSRPTMRLSGIAASAVSTEITIIAVGVIERPVDAPRIPLVEPVEEAALPSSSCRSRHRRASRSASSASASA